MIRKIRLNLKFVTSQPEKQTLAIHTVPNISRSKGNQTLKFGQLIEHNIRINFLEYHTQNMVAKLFPEPFLRSQN